MEDKNVLITIAETKAPGLAGNHSNHHKYAEGGQERHILESHDHRGDLALRGGDGSIN